MTNTWTENLFVGCVGPHDPHERLKEIVILQVRMASEGISNSTEGGHAYVTHHSDQQSWWEARGRLTPKTIGRLGCGYDPVALRTTAYDSAGDSRYFPDALSSALVAAARYLSFVVPSVTNELNSTSPDDAIIAACTVIMWRSGGVDRGGERRVQQGYQRSKC